MALAFQAGEDALDRESGQGETAAAGLVGRGPLLRGREKVDAF
jgi:hypothetical protein